MPSTDREYELRRDADAADLGEMAEAFDAAART